MIDLKRQIVLVDADRSVLQHAVFGKIFLQQRQQILFMQRTFVDQLHRFFRTRNRLVVFVENRDEIGKEIFAFIENALAQAVELFVINRKRVFFKYMVERKILEQCIALAQYFLVLNEFLQIMRIELRNHAVDEFAPRFAAFGDQIDIGRGNDHKRDKPDVVGEFVVWLAVALEDFLLSFFEAAHDLLGTVFLFEGAIDDEKFLAVLDVLHRERIEIAFPVCQMIDRIEHIGLADAVLADKAIDLAVELEFGLGKILVIEKGNLF